MAKQSKSAAKKRGKGPVKTAAPVLVKQGVAKAGEVVQTILGTMAGVVSGIGILVTGTDAEKQAKAGAVKKAAVRKKPTAKKTVKKAAAKKVAAKKAKKAKA